MRSHEHRESNKTIMKREKDLNKFNKIFFMELYGSIAPLHFKINQGHRGFWKNKLTRRIGSSVDGNKQDYARWALCWDETFGSQICIRTTRALTLITWAHRNFDCNLQKVNIWAEVENTFVDDTDIIKGEHADQAMNCETTRRWRS